MQHFIDKSIDEEILKSVIKNKKLSDKEKEFCLRYIKTFNTLQSYYKVYKCSYKTASANAYKLIKKTRIKEEIKKLKEIRFKSLFLNIDDVFLQHVAIAFADITDFVEFGTKIQDDKKINYLQIKNSDEVNGTLISDIKASADETVSIKLVDKQKSLEWLSKFLLAKAQTNAEDNSLESQLMREISALPESQKQRFIKVLNTINKK